MAVTQLASRRPAVYPSLATSFNSLTVVNIEIPQHRLLLSISKKAILCDYRSDKYLFYKTILSAAEAAEAAEADAALHRTREIQVSHSFK